MNEYKYVEEFGSFYFREFEDGEAKNTISMTDRITFVYDGSNHCILKHGDTGNVTDWANLTRDGLRSRGFTKMANDLHTITRE